MKQDIFCLIDKVWNMVLFKDFRHIIAILLHISCDHRNITVTVPLLPCQAHDLAGGKF